MKYNVSTITDLKTGKKTYVENLDWGNGTSSTTVTRSDGKQDKYYKRNW